MQDAAQASGLEQELEPAGAEEPGRVATFQPS